jgi:hypothetical protein
LLLLLVFIDKKESLVEQSANNKEQITKSNEQSKDEQSKDAKNKKSHNIL